MAKRWSYLLLFYFSLILVVRIARSDSVEASLSDDVVPSTLEAELQPHDGRSNAEFEEVERYVTQAKSILRSIKPPTAASKRKEASSAYLSTFLYYLQKLLDTIFIANVPTQEEPVNAAPRGNGKNSNGGFSEPLAKAVDLLTKAATKQQPDAIYLLADMNFYGNYSHPRNYPAAFSWYKTLASLTGNSTAQNMVGFMYATGYAGAVERDQSKALLYHTFAALGGNTRSEMTLAYRNHAGIGTPRNCDEAAFYYKRVADKAMKYYWSGPPGGMHLPRHHHKIADEDGGVYGEGASHSSAGQNKKRFSDSNTGTSMEDILEYLDLMARKGDLSATFQLAKLYYQGPRGMSRNLSKAKKHFFTIAKELWPSTGKETSAPSDSLLDYASKSAGYLGRMYMRGEALDQDFAKAREWFLRGIKYGDAISQHGLAYLYENGMAGLEVNLEKAKQLYKSAANDDYGPAQVSIGKIFYNQGEYSVANKWFELATRHGNVEAYYWLAEINNNGNGRERSCGMATIYFKHVSERVEALQAPLEWAHRAFKNNNRESSLIGFMMAGEQGYESGQANVAFLLDERKSRLEIDFWKPKRNDVMEQELALIYWTRSAKQQNIDSFVKMGDYYLSGTGTEPDNEKAAACYIAASEFQQSAQALWNLGWMHENGVGVEQDYHLAKRYYDQALESNSEAYLPVTMSLLKLRARSFWNTITGGSINAIGADPEPEKEFSFGEWMRKWFSDDKTDGTRADQHADTQEAAAEGTEETRMPDVGGNDYYDEDFEDDMIENVLILLLLLAVSVLFIVRSQRQQARRQRLAQQQQNGGQVPAVVAAAVGAQPPLQPEDPRNNPWGIPPPPGF